AMGSSARRFPGVHDARVATLRTVGDYRHLRALAQEGARIVVVGGGYIGSEVAAALTRTGAEGTPAPPGPQLLGPMCPSSLPVRTGTVRLPRGGSLRSGSALSRLVAGVVRVRPPDAGAALPADAVPLGLGAELTTTLAPHAAPDVAGAAVLVDPFLRTSAP